MGPILLIGLIAWAVLGSKPSTAPPPQQTLTPQQPTGQQTGQVVADVAMGAIDLFRQIVAASNGTTAK